MFEQFSERARKTMSFGRQEAQRLNSEFIGAEHILLGILKEGGGVASMVIKRVGVEPSRIREEVEKLIGPKPVATSTLGQLPFTPRAKRVIELAGETSSQLGHGVTGTEHLLLALIKENESVAAQVLSMLGFKLDAVLGMVLDIFAQGEEAKKGTYPNTSEGARQKLAEIQKRIQEGPSKPISTNMKIWLFMAESVGTKGTLVVQGSKYGASHIVVLDGIPVEKREAIADVLAKECGAA